MRERERERDAKVGRGGGGGGAKISTVVPHFSVYKTAGKFQCSVLVRQKHEKDLMYMRVINVKLYEAKKMVNKQTERLLVY